MRWGPPEFKKSYITYIIIIIIIIIIISIIGIIIPPARSAIIYEHRVGDGLYMLHFRVNLFKYIQSLLLLLLLLLSSLLLILLLHKIVL